MAKRHDGAPKPDELQAFVVPENARVRREAIHATEAAERAEHAAQEAQREREQQRIDKARKGFVRKTDLGHILSDWETLNETGAIDHISREDMRRVDMHVAFNDPRLLERLRAHPDDTGEFFAHLDQTVQGDAHEPTTTDFMSDDSKNPFGHFQAMSDRTGRVRVEQGADLRTRNEHESIRIGVEAAARATNMRDFLHILDTQIGTALGSKLTSYERAVLHDQLERILAGRDWPHPTQEIAQSFFVWERIFGNEVVTAASHTTTYVAARFLPEQPPRRQPSDWENFKNAPRDLVKLIFDEDGARTGKGKKKE